MITRKRYLETIRERLEHFPVVSVLGPRQVGKTTLAQEIAGEQSSHFFDLEDVDALARLAEPKAALERLEGLVVLDEVQRKPELFALLRVLADRKPMEARFLLTGSASPSLVRGVSESLAGRVAMVDVAGFNLEEVGEDEWRKLWWRGGGWSSMSPSGQRAADGGRNPAGPNVVQALSTPAHNRNAAD